MILEDDKKADKPKSFVGDPTKVNAACELSLANIFKQMHEKAKDLADKVNKDYEVQNSAFNNKGEFNGPGHHVIVALAKNGVPVKKDCLPVIQTYIQWFSGPDVANKIKEDTLWPIGENGPIDQTQLDAQTQAEEKNKAENKDKEEKAEESLVVIPRFSTFLKEANDGDANGKEKLSPKGYYVTYEIEVQGQKGSPIMDAFKKYLKSFFDDAGITFGDMWGGKGEKKTIGDLKNALAAIFGKLDPDELKTRYTRNVTAKFPQTTAKDIELWDNTTIIQHLKKQLETKDISTLKSKSKYSMCTRVYKKGNKSYKLFNKQVIADLMTQSIKGIYKKFKNKVDKKDIILVNRFSDDEKDPKAPKLDKKKEEDVSASLTAIRNMNNIYDMLFEETDDDKKTIELDETAIIDETTKEIQNIESIKTVASADEKYKEQIDSAIEVKIASIEDVNNLINSDFKDGDVQTIEAGDGKYKQVLYAIVPTVVDPKHVEEVKESRVISDTLKDKLISEKLLRNVYDYLGIVLEAGDDETGFDDESRDDNDSDIDDSVNDEEKKAAEEEANKKQEEAAAQRAQEKLDGYKKQMLNDIKSDAGLLLPSVDQVKEVFVKVLEKAQIKEYGEVVENLSIDNLEESIKSTAKTLTESLLLEGHDEFYSNCLKEIKRVGIKNIQDGVDTFRDEWKKIMDGMKEDKGKGNVTINLPAELNKREENKNTYIKYLKKAYVKGADSTPFDKNVIAKLRKAKDEDEVIKIFTDYAGPIESDASEVPEFYAAWKALQKLPSKKKITIKFMDKDPTDKNSKPEEFDSIEGFPHEFKKEDYPDVTEVTEYDNFKFDKYEPDPNTLDDDGEVVATYIKNAIEVTFIDKHPAGGEDKEIAKVAKEPDKPIDDDKMPEEPSHKGFTFKKWDPDPNKMDKSGETYSTYDEADDEDEKDEDQNVKVHFKDVDPTEGDIEKAKESAKEIATNEMDGSGKVEYPEDPKRPGYIFTGWEPKPEEAIKDDPDASELTTYSTYIKYLGTKKLFAIPFNAGDNSSGAEDLDTKETGIDFYIIPMPGLKVKSTDNDDYEPAKK